PSREERARTGVAANWDRLFIGLAPADLLRLAAAAPSERWHGDRWKFPPRRRSRCLFYPAGTESGKPSLPERRLHRRHSGKTPIASGCLASKHIRKTVLELR